MLLSKFFVKDAANSMITKVLKEQTFFQSPIKKFQKIIRSCQPQHWFDGFMDDVTIELKELK